ncbi:hypothetical protein Pcinc_006476 [Petrolisthes cinctipes]|uniref:Uncharacterized protein n=1 Tax=Petrolisthes cinctipes TaxID=88211 RepID=A0AAE1GD18_PETCI|nr:hypothetical protein Pcinc_006476 [Petrolisthes cinctipes]
MYDKNNTMDKVDEARLDLFARKQRPYDGIPPTSAALIQHVKRSLYQASCIWGQAKVCKMHTGGGRKMGTPIVDNRTACISLSSVDKPSSVNELHLHIIPEVQTTTNQQVIESVPEVVQYTMNRQVVEGAVRDKQNATNNEENVTKYEPRTPKKRGRKRKLPGGRRSRPKKVKLYKMND